MDRRAFVETLATAALATHVSRFPFPVSRIPRIGLQLHTVRDLMQRDMAGTLAAIAKIGYQEVELTGYYNKTPGDIRVMLETNGLVAPSGHVAFETIDTRWDQVLDAAHTLGHRYVVVPSIPEQARKDIDGWMRVADTLNRAGEACSRSNLTLAYHNHSDEFVPLAGQVPYDVLLAATDPALVKLEIDLFWITYGGQDPLAYFAKYPGRVPLVHVKDMAPKPRPEIPPDSVMRDVGKGTIDWKRIFAQSQQAGIKHYFVEHDSPGDALASAKASFDYLKALEF